MKKKLYLNLAMGISILATPAILLASCRAQASGAKLQITKKASPNAVSAEAPQVTTIPLKTVQKPFRFVSQGVALGLCLPKTAWPPTHF